MDCLFCRWATSDDGTTLASTHFVAVADRYPVTAQHHLLIPRQHRADVFALAGAESADMAALLQRLRTKLCAEDPTISGFNIGANCGRDAGQTVMHCHVHVIPRRHGDMADPAGGVRGVLPERQKYALGHGEQ